MNRVWIVGDSTGWLEMLDLNPGFKGIKVAQS
jgi:hypothetical protein